MSFVAFKSTLINAECFMLFVTWGLECVKNHAETFQYAFHGRGLGEPLFGHQRAVPPESQ